MVGGTGDQPTDRVAPEVRIHRKEGERSDSAPAKRILEPECLAASRATEAIDDDREAGDGVRILGADSEANADCRGDVGEPPATCAGDTACELVERHAQQ